MVPEVMIVAIIDSLRRELLDLVMFMSALVPFTAEIVVGLRDCG